jgi:uncharacterized membrane protein YeaQ/YmgE (transglycosylase-associated protein family)
MGIGELIVLIIIGAIIGALGRLVIPGKNPMGVLLTIGVGVVAALVAGFVFNGILQWIVAVVLAALLVLLVGKLMGGSSRSRR